MILTTKRTDVGVAPKRYKKEYIFIPFVKGLNLNNIKLTILPKNILSRIYFDYSGPIGLLKFLIDPNIYITDLSE